MGEVMEEKTVQVRFQVIGHPRSGLFKTMTKANADQRFNSEAWILKGVTTTVIDDTLQLLVHHYVSSEAPVEVWYVITTEVF